MTREMGKVLAETRGDVQEAIDEAFYVAGEGRRLVRPNHAQRVAEQVCHERAHAGGRGGADYALELSHGDSQLEAVSRAGLAAILVSSSRRKIRRFRLTTWCRRWSTRACRRAWSILSAALDRRRALRWWSTRDVRAISFTGSSEVGSLVAQRAAATFKPVSLEMGGKNAQIVMDDANLELALEGALWGGFGTTGQRCTATSRILLQKGIADRFTAEFVARARKLKVGNGLDESVEVGPQVNPSQIATSARYVEIALAEGAKLLAGGHALTEGAYAHGTFFAPTVIGGVTPSMRIAREEVFGPVVSLIEFETFEEAIEIANSIDYGLSTALYTRDVNRAFAAIRDLEAGITYINAPTIGAEVHLPFGGVKHTGNGHREGNGAIDFFTTWKAVYVDYCDKLQRAQIDNAE